MKIGLVLPAIPAYSETFFRSKIEGLKREGHEVLLFVKEPPTYSFDLCNVVVAPSLYRFHKRWFWEWFRVLGYLLFNFPKAFRLFSLHFKNENSYFKAFQNVLINAHFLPYTLDWLHFGFGTLALGRIHVAEAIGAQMGVSFRGFDLFIYPVKHPGCYRELFSKTVYYHVLSEQMKQHLMACGVPEHFIQIIPPALKLEDFKPSDRALASPYRLLTVGRLHWKKGLESVLTALAILQQEGVDFTYTIVGSGPELERLQFAVYQLGLTERVFFKGKLPHAEVLALYQDHQIYIQYSFQEGFCNAVLEAQASGLLCVVSDADGLDENILHGVTGWVVPKRNPKALAAQLIEVTQLSPAVQSEFRARAYKRVQIGYGLELQQQSFAAFYSQKRD